MLMRLVQEGYALSATEFASLQQAADKAQALIEPDRWMQRDPAAIRVSLAENTKTLNKVKAAFK